MQPDSHAFSTSVQLASLSQEDEEQQSPRELTVAQLFEQQVQRTPETRALTCGTDTLTYKELEATANRWACELRQRGVVPRTRIVVALDRSFELVVGLLAVLKAGSTYV